MSLFMMSGGISQLLTLPIGGLAQWATLELVMPMMGWIALAGVATIALTQPAVRRAGRAPAAEGAYRPLPVIEESLSGVAG
jgi:hypothetical protein